MPGMHWPGMIIMKITHEIKRKLIQLTAFGFSNSHIQNLAGGKIYKGKWKNFCNPGINCYSCPAARMACPIGAMQAVGGSPKYGFSFYALGFVLAIGVIFGRTICGYVCPFGLIQELLHKIPSPQKRLPKPFTYVKYVLLLAFVFILPAVLTDKYGRGIPAFCQYICPAGTLEGGIPILLTHIDLRRQLGPVFVIKAMLLIGTIIACIICCRFFCKAMCPLGAIYGLLNKVSFHRLHLKKEACISCGRCQDVCPMDVNPAEHPDSMECIRCGRCVGACPNHVIHIGFSDHAKDNTNNVC